MRQKQKAIMMYKIVNGLAPTCLSEMLTFSNDSNEYNLRQSELNLELKNKTEYYNSSFAFTGAKLSNFLPDKVKRQSSLNNFKRFLNALLSAPTYPIQIIFL